METGHNLPMGMVWLTEKPERQLRQSGFLQYGFADVLCRYAEIQFEAISNIFTIPHGLLGSLDDIEKVCRTSERVGATYLDTGRCPRESRNCLPIGSPWLYILKMSNLLERTQICREQEVSEKVKTFVIPHSSTSQKFNRNSDALRDFLLDWIKHSCEPNSIILFHWADFLDQSWVEGFRELGLAMKCVGYGGHPNSTNSYNSVGGRPDFLWRTLSLLNDTSELHIFEPTSLTYYASSIGVELKLPTYETYKHLFPLIYPEDSLSQSKRNRVWENTFLHLKIQKQLEVLNPELKILTALEFLGISHLKSKEEMLKILTSKSTISSRTRRVFSRLR